MNGLISVGKWNAYYYDEMGIKSSLREDQRQLAFDPNFENSINEGYALVLAFDHKIYALLLDGQYFKYFDKFAVF